MQERLEEILAEYPRARHGPFGRAAPVWQSFVRAVEALAYTDAVERRLNVFPDWSAGNGRWTAVPRIALTDARETETMRHGTYVALLFRADGSGVALCVTQGTGAAVSADAGAALVAGAERIRRRAGRRLRSAGFDVAGELDLHATTPFARACERAAIAFKLYEQGAVPPDAELVTDLEVALSVVDEHVASGRGGGGRAGAAAGAAARDSAAAGAAARDGAAGAAAPDLAAIAAELRGAVDASGLLVPRGDGDRVQALVAALVTKPFVILTGMSGSGKTQLALRLGDWFGRDGERGRCLTVAVRPDWTGPEALFGYEDALRRPRDGRAAWFVPATLEFLLAAAREPAMPHLLVLDEMNLAHVERYFSDFLSGMESGRGVLPDLVRDDGGEWRLREGASELLPLPGNVFVVGTVNVDETTYLFSPKVLDRATTFEIRTATSELEGATRALSATGEGRAASLRELCRIAADADWHLARHEAFADTIAGRLRTLHAALAETGDEFGHRAFGESLRLAVALREAGGASEDRTLDHVVLLKILPRIHGSRRRVGPVLQRLLAYAHDPSGTRAPSDGAEPEDARLPLSARKLLRMTRTVEADQFVSFAE